MSVLVFDTETTGFVHKSKPLEDPAQPHIVQLGAILHDVDGCVRGELNLLVKPEGKFTIPAEATAVHGITTEMAEAYGVPLVVALAAFNQLSKCASVLVAHNLEFDMQISEIAYLRIGKQTPWAVRDDLQRFCTMRKAKPILRLPDRDNPRELKNPNLTEAHQHFLGRGFEGAHDAMADVRACAAVYFRLVDELARQGVYSELLQHGAERVEKARGYIVEMTEDKRGITGRLTCPICSKVDALTYHVYQDGRVSGVCETPDCVRWME